MKTLKVLSIFFLVTFSSFSQGKNEPDSLFHKIYLLDSMWSPGAISKTSLRDSLSYFEIKGNRVEYCLKTTSTQVVDKGKVIYWRAIQDTSGLALYSFYISGRGAFKGSLTASIQQLDTDNYVIYLLSPFATFEKHISAKEGKESEIIRPLKKKYKP